LSRDSILESSAASELDPSPPRERFLTARTDRSGAAG